jgi:hypothetical protein
MRSEVKIRTEEKLLLGLCHLEFGDDDLVKIKFLIAEVDDWDYFKNLANLHGVAALVWFNLEKHGLFSGIPDVVATYLKSTQMISLSRNTFITEAMGEVLHLLNNSKIKTVILKGFALENSVYGNSGLRQMSDVDILIDRDQCITARDILVSNGFISLPLKSFYHKFILAYYGKHLPPLIKNGLSVEIHHELFGVSNKNLTRILYESSFEVDIKGKKTWFPQPQIFFLYLVKHLWLHEINNESQLRLYGDLIVLLEKHYEEILSHNLIKFAAEAGMSEILASHLRPLRDIWGISFPDWTNSFIDKFSSKESLTNFIFFLKSPKNNPSVEKPKLYRHIINDIPGFHRKFLYVLGDVFPALSFMKKRYKCKNAWQVIRYYPFRLGKILWLIRK